MTDKLTPYSVGRADNNVFQSGCAMLFILAVMIAIGWLGRMAWVAVTTN